MEREACSQVAKSPVEVLSSAALLVQHRGGVHVLPVGGVQKGDWAQQGFRTVHAVWLFIQCFWRNREADQFNKLAIHLWIFLFLFQILNYLPLNTLQLCITIWHYEPCKCKPWNIQNNMLLFFFNWKQFNETSDKILMKIYR